MRPLEEFITPTQEELFQKLKQLFEGNVSSCRNSYVLVHGDAPVLLIAHLDTVHKEPVRQICKTHNSNILMSPQGIGGDDRCGVYGIITAYERSAVKPWLLFTCDEEIGGVGASQFCLKHEKGKLPKELDALKLIIELDRKGKSDAVFYDCDNPEFEKYIIGKGFKTEFGSFSDISVIAPELGVAAVNLSSGYYNAHSLHEYINRKHLNATVRRVVDIIADAVNPEFPTYEYIEAENVWIGKGASYYNPYFDPKYHGHTSKKHNEADSLTKLPADTREMYVALLDFYDIGEIEALREEHGDNIISMMFESEFGTLEGYYGYMGIDAPAGEEDFDDGK